MQVASCRMVGSDSVHGVHGTFQRHPSVYSIRLSRPNIYSTIISANSTAT